MLTNQIKMQTAYVSGKGVYELWDQWLPNRPQYPCAGMDRLQSANSVSDIRCAPYLTTERHTPSNVIGAFVAEGWCYGSVGAVATIMGRRIRSWCYVSPSPILTARHVRTDLSWSCSTNGPIRFASIYDGESTMLPKKVLRRTGGGNKLANHVHRATTVSNVVGAQMTAQPNEPRQITEQIRPSPCGTQPRIAAKLFSSL